MCGACCALAEQLLATADDVAEVEDECDQLLRRAAESDPRSAEPLQVLASLRSQQGRAEEALEALRRSVATWRSRRGGRDVDPDADLDDDADEDRADEHLGEYEVSYEFRFETAKLLLELDESVDGGGGRPGGTAQRARRRRGRVAAPRARQPRQVQLRPRAGARDARGAAEREAGGDEATHANLMELRLAIEESKEKWNEEVGEEHRGGGDDMSD